HPLPIDKRHLPHRQGAAAADAGVVAEDVDVAERFEGGIGEAFDVVLFEDVRADGQYLTALLFDGRFRHRERFGFDIGDDDVHAFFGEAVGEGEAHAAGSASDDGHAAIKVFHARNLRSVSASLFGTLREFRRPGHRGELLVGWALCGGGRYEDGLDAEGVGASGVFVPVGVFFRTDDVVARELVDVLLGTLHIGEAADMLPGAAVLVFYLDEAPEFVGHRHESAPCTRLRRPRVQAKISSIGRAKPSRVKAAWALLRASPEWSVATSPPAK